MHDFAWFFPGTYPFHCSYDAWMPCTRVQCLFFSFPTTYFFFPGQRSTFWQSVDLVAHSQDSLQDCFWCPTVKFPIPKGLDLSSYRPLAGNTSRICPFAIGQNISDVHSYSIMRKSEFVVMVLKRSALYSRKVLK